MYGNEKNAKTPVQISAYTKDNKETKNIADT
jgi:hypothetical protein